MAIVRWTPTGLAASPRYQRTDSGLDSLRSQMMRLFDDFLDRPGIGEVRRSGVFPPLNISEDDDNLYITTELPGISASDLDIRLENNKVVLNGERKIAQVDENESYHRHEREAGTFRRIVSLPAKVDPDNVSAASCNGVLEIKLPKAVEAKQRQITVETE